MEKWSRNSESNIRFIWLDVTGMPVHGWTTETFNRVTVIRGKIQLLMLVL